MQPQPRMPCQAPRGLCGDIHPAKTRPLPVTPSLTPLLRAAGFQTCGCHACPCRSQGPPPPYAGCENVGPLSINTPWMNVYQAQMTCMAHFDAGTKRGCFLTANSQQTQYDCMDSSKALQTLNSEARIVGNAQAPSRFLARPANGLLVMNQPGVAMSSNSDEHPLDSTCGRVSSCDQCYGARNSRGSSCVWVRDNSGRGFCASVYKLMSRDATQYNGKSFWLAACPAKQEDTDGCPPVRLPPTASKEERLRAQHICAASVSETRKRTCMLSAVAVKGGVAPREPWNCTDSADLWLTGELRRVLTAATPNIQVASSQYSNEVTLVADCSLSKSCETCFNHKGADGSSCVWVAKQNAPGVGMCASLPVMLKRGLDAVLLSCAATESKNVADVKARDAESVNVEKPTPLDKSETISGDTKPTPLESGETLSAEGTHDPRNSPRPHEESGKEGDKMAGDGEVSADDPRPRAGEEAGNEDTTDADGDSAEEKKPTKEDNKDTDEKTPVKAEDRGDGTDKEGESAMGEPDDSDSGGSEGTAKSEDSSVAAGKEGADKVDDGGAGAASVDDSPSNEAAAAQGAAAPDVGGKGADQGKVSESEGDPEVKEEKEEEEKEEGGDDGKPSGSSAEESENMKDDSNGDTNEGRDKGAGAPDSDGEEEAADERFQQVGCGCNPCPCQSKGQQQQHQLPQEPQITAAQAAQMSPAERERVRVARMKARTERWNKHAPLTPEEIQQRYEHDNRWINKQWMHALDLIQPASGCPSMGGCQDKAVDGLLHTTEVAHNADGGALDPPPKPLDLERPHGEEDDSSSSDSSSSSSDSDEDSEES